MNIRNKNIDPCARYKNRLFSSLMAIMMLTHDNVNTFGEYFIHIISYSLCLHLEIKWYVTARLNKG